MGHLGGFWVDRSQDVCSWINRDDSGRLSGDVIKDDACDVVNTNGCWDDQGLYVWNIVNHIQNKLS